MMRGRVATRRPGIGLRTLSCRLLACEGPGCRVGVRAGWVGVGDAPARGRVVVEEGPAEPPERGGPEGGVRVGFVEEPSEEPGRGPVPFGPCVVRGAQPESVVRRPDLNPPCPSRPSRRAVMDLGHGPAAADAPGMRLQDRGAHPGRERTARHYGLVHSRSPARRRPVDGWRATRPCARPTRGRVARWSAPRGTRGGADVTPNSHLPVRRRRSPSTRQRT